MPKLTALFVRTTKEPGAYGDGPGGFGLTLRVRETKDEGRVTKRWVQRIRVNGRVTNLGLGSFPEVSLAEAREQALENRRKILRGVDPRQEAGGDSIPTFEQAVEQVIALRRPDWRPGSRTEHKWRVDLGRHALPHLGGVRVDKITGRDVLAVLRPLLADGKLVTARKIRQRVSAVMRWAVANGYRIDNPADAITAALPKAKHKTRHHRALPHAEVGAALATIRESPTEWDGVKLAVEFLVLTAARSGEVRGARWEEVDEETAVWTVPADRTKAGRAHRVPLSSRALKVLEEARDLPRGRGEHEGLVFPSLRRVQITVAVLGGALLKLGVPGTVHGFRSSFRDYCADTGVAQEVAEAALAHVKESVERAYARSDLLERRRSVMEAWSAYLQETDTP
ncbi:MAG: integrase arm-type DNA-binding domain-containing protein [Gemmatimonadota bacterium]|nr:integrase arm-type DNA-binding domain-containing protein [Gemmatimonadota bacterium]